MSNLHKDLLNDQIHNPKDFDGAAVSTKLTKNAGGNLEWVADTHPTDAVSQIIAGTNVTVSPISGVGAVTVNSTGGGGETNVAIHQKTYGSIADTNQYCMSAPSGNNEHKFSVDLGAAPTTISFKDAVQGSVYTITKVTELPIVWVGHVYGNVGLIVEFKLLHVPWGAECQSSGDAPTFCELATTGTIDLTGNASPICFNVETFSELCDTVVGDIIVLTAEVSGEFEGNAFSMEQTVRYE